MITLNLTGSSNSKIFFLFLDSGKQPSIRSVSYTHLSRSLFFNEKQVNHKVHTDSKYDRPNISMVIAIILRYLRQKFIINLYALFMISCRVCNIQLLEFLSHSQLRLRSKRVWKFGYRVKSYVLILLVF